MADPFLGVKQGILKDEVAPVPSSLIAIKSSIIKPSLPADQSTKVMSVSLADAADLFFVGNTESATLTTVYEDGDSVVTQNFSNLVLFNNFAGSATLLGNIENDVLNNLSNGTNYTLFVCNQDTIENLTGYDDSLLVFTTLTGTFTATEIVGNLIISALPNRTGGGVRNAVINFNRTNVPDLINNHYDNIEVTLLGV